VLAQVTTYTIPMFAYSFASCAFSLMLRGAFQADLAERGTDRPEVADASRRRDAGVREPRAVAPCLLVSVVTMRRRLPTEYAAPPGGS
jgi:hypothetical protein